MLPYIIDTIARFVNYLFSLNQIWHLTNEIFMLVMSPGTMANLICMLTHCRQTNKQGGAKQGGCEVIMGNQSHLYLWAWGEVPQVRSFISILKIYTYRIVHWNKNPIWRASEHSHISGFIRYPESRGKSWNLISIPGIFLKFISHGKVMEFDQH